MDCLDYSWLDSVTQMFCPALVDDWACHSLAPFVLSSWQQLWLFFRRPVSSPRRSGNVSARRWKCWSAFSTPTLSASTTPGSRRWRATNASFWWRNSWRRARSKREHLTLQNTRLCHVLVVKYRMSPILSSTKARCSMALFPRSVFLSALEKLDLASPLFVYLQLLEEIQGDEAQAAPALESTNPERASLPAHANASHHPQRPEVWQHLHHGPHWLCQDWGSGTRHP